jgi:hypothetical protein
MKESLGAEFWGVGGKTKTVQLMKSLFRFRYCGAKDNDLMVKLELVSTDPNQS